MLDTARTKRIDVLFLQEVHSGPNSGFMGKGMGKAGVSKPRHLSQRRTGHPALQVA